MGESAFWLGIAASAIGSAAAGAAGAWWWQSRAVKALRVELQKSERTCTAALERSRQARTQIAQLQQALAAAKAEAVAHAQQAGSPAGTAGTGIDAPAPQAADDVNARVERLSRALEDSPLLRPRHEMPSHGFADTIPYD